MWYVVEKCAYRWTTSATTRVSVTCFTKFLKRRITYCNKNIVVHSVTQLPATRYERHARKKGADTTDSKRVQQVRLDKHVHRSGDKRVRLRR